MKNILNSSAFFHNSNEFLTEFKNDIYQSIYSRCRDIYTKHDAIAIPRAEIQFRIFSGTHHRTIAVNIYTKLFLTDEINRFSTPRFTSIGVL